MSLGDFMTDQSLGSWADEMEDIPVILPQESRSGYGTERRAFSSGTGFGERSFDRPGFAREQLPLPTKPPFTAHLGNLSFEATELDIQDFFSGCEVTSVRIVEDKLERKPKGFGYVEFATVDGLKRALDLSGTQFQGRSIRISVADPRKLKAKDAAPARDIQWERKGPLPDLPGQSNRRASERGGGFGRNWDNTSDAGSDRGAPFERGGSRRGGAGPLDAAAVWERRGPLSPLQGSSSSNVSHVDGRAREGGPRRSSPAWGEGTGRGPSGPGPQDSGSRPPRGERPGFERTPTAADLDPSWRTGMKKVSPTPTPEASTPSSPSNAAAVPAAPSAPAGRPRLNLAKRTISEHAGDTAATEPSDAKASPFGAARPIDSAAREREIEEKLRARKEAEAKEREERRAKEAAVKAEKAAERAAEKVAQARESHKESEGQDTDRDENGEKAPGSNFEVLRRTAEDGGDQDVQEERSKQSQAQSPPPQATNGAGSAGGRPKPLPIRERQSSRRGEGESSWRRKSSTPSAAGAAAAAGGVPETPTTPAEEEGWSTVGGRSKGGRRGGGGGGGGGWRNA
ncbi:hypothetical protein BDY21DRAFT_374970 [Lineolata rhizophorae]|uniref:RRM domain-containing protein n=1 Tax=Lineolata rhizophorae TaxID=578093 RepID=A0A6A6NP27_9PEZI|nr:hypothetical protein BDY21DRAFT_374970 [Lineolata rhizophorae]